MDALSSSRRASLGLPAPHTPPLSEWRAGSLCLNIAYLISLGASVHHLRTISATLFALSITDGHCGITPPPRLTRLKAYANKHAQCCHSRPRASERAKIRAPCARATDQAHSISRGNGFQAVFAVSVKSARFHLDFGLVRGFEFLLAESV